MAAFGRVKTEPQEVAESPCSASLGIFTLVRRLLCYGCTGSQLFSASRYTHGSREGVGHVVHGSRTSTGGACCCFRAFRRSAPKTAFGIM